MSDTTKEVHQPGAGIRNFYELSPAEEEHEAKILVACRKYLQKRGISAEYVQHAIDEGWIMAWDGARQARIREKEKEYRITGKYPGVPTFAVPGMAVCYQPCLDERTRVRVRYFQKTIENEEGEEVAVPRWVASAGDTVPWLRAIPEAGWTDPRVPIVIVEAPTKAMALAQYGVAALGLGGADAGLHDPEHPERMNAEAARIVWRGRLVYILSDAGQMRNPQVAHGVGRMAYLLSQAGADVRVCYLPEKVPTKDFQDPKSYDQGPDDYLARVYQDAHDRLAGRAALDKNEERSKKREDRVEAVARRVARLALSRLLREAHPWQPWELVKALRTAKAELEPLLEDLPFLACLQHSGETGLARTAHAWGRGGKGLLQGALKGVREEFAKASEDQSPYKVVAGKLCYGDQELAAFSATIVEEVFHDDGESRELHFKLQGRLPSGATLPEADVPASKFSRMEWVVEKWGAKACIAPKKEAYVRAAIQSLSEPTQRTVYTATGWRQLDGEWVFLLPGGGIGANGFVDVEVQGAKLPRYKRPSLPTDDAHALMCLEESLTALGVGPGEAMAPLLSMVYAAPLEPLLPQGLNLTLWLKGDSGSRKSSVAAAVGQSHYGDFPVGESLIGRWGATVTALEAQLSRAAHIPYTIDNAVTPRTEREKSRFSETVSKVVINVGDRSGRQRCDQTATERPEKTPRAAVISTAEVLPPDGDSALGRTFIVEVDSKLAPINLEYLSHCQSPEVRERMQTATGGYLRWLAQQDRERLRQELEGQVYATRDEAVGQLPGAHSRTPSNVAVLYAGIWAWTRYAESVGMPFERAEAVRKVFLARILDAARKQPRAVHIRPLELFLDAVRTMLRTGVAALCPGPEDSLQSTPDSQYIGWVDGEEVLLHPTATIQAVRRYLGDRWAVTDTELGDQLRKSTTVEDVGDIPVLRETDGSRTTCRRRAGGSRVRVWALDRRVLGDVTYDGLRPVEWTQEDEDSLVEEV